MEFSRRGYGTQILKTLLDYLKNELKAKKFIWSCFSENIASKRLALKFGFVYTHSEKKIRKHDDLHYVADFYEKVL